ncbi:hypothetical protein CAEBREN_22318 [Caenorhabditis brenneri]|uniref:Uncharacterized protein n=1 Tax=Caenorhabditis brenneri TaxID=135651 RepID=G0MCN0_CAEBE|nr:hypothetical protein CAEBREN_22318 [Caenorhabditis brenneri]
MNAEQKEKEEAAWKAAHDASIAAANAQKAFFDAIREASEEDLANFLAGRARIIEQIQYSEQNGAPDDKRTTPGATNPQVTSPNSSDATATTVRAPSVIGLDFLPRAWPFHGSQMEDEHKRSPSPFSELLERGCGRPVIGRPRKNKFKK